jgi:Activator of Hsp90 ATPase homolog 1-like protein
MNSARIGQHINAPRAVVYRAPLDPRAIAKWKVPAGTTCHVHAFDAREGGSFRISLTYDAPTATGKTTAHMVRTGIVTHPQEGPFSGYHEIQEPRKRYGLIDQERLIELERMSVK